MAESAEHMESDRELLIRLDERVRNAVTTMEQRDIYHRQEMDRLAKLIVDMTGAFTAAVTNISTGFASRADVEAAKAAAKADHAVIAGSVGRVERIVYGACAVILVAVIVALLSGIGLTVRR
jgi:hypothetical protein